MTILMFVGVLASVAAQHCPRSGGGGVIAMEAGGR